MIPDPGEILRRRVTTATNTRLLAFLPIMIAWGIATIWITVALTERLYLDNHVAFGIATALFVLLAILIWVTAPSSARRAIRVPKSIKCPACQYKIEGLTTPQCPECGLPLTAEFLAKPGEKTPPPRDPDRVMLRQIVTGVLRTLGVVSYIPAIPALLASSIEIFRSTRPAESAYVVAAVTISVMIIGATLILLSKPVSGLIVPSRTAFEPSLIPSAEDNHDHVPPIG